MFFTVALAASWFFLYWVIGGVFFACVALLKLKKIHKVRFSCLFTFVSAACAWGAAWLGIFLARDEITECAPAYSLTKKMSEKVFTCGLSEFIFSALIGLVVLVVIGFGLLKLSSRKDQAWLTAFVERLDYNNKEDERE